MELTIVDQNGWKKPYTFVKAVVRIGSSATSDIQLSSPAITPIHLQVMCAPEAPGNCKVLNLGSVVQWRSGGKVSAIESYMAVDARDGDELTLGEYRILFHLPLSAGMIMSSRQIAASLSMDDAVLRSDIPAVGFLRLQNLGKNPNCQFQVALNGLPEECFQIDPPPVLYPGAEEEVRIQFFHRGTVPPAGQQVITISVTAPGSYPGEQVIIQQGLYVSPVLKAGINLVDDMPLPIVKSTAPEASANVPAPKVEPPVPASTAEETPLPKVETTESSHAYQSEPSVPVLPKEETGDLQTASTVDDVPLPKADVLEPPKGKAEPRKSKMKPSVVVTSSPAETEEAQAIPTFAPPESAIPVQKDVFVTKVVRNPSETYWDDKS